MQAQKAFIFVLFAFFAAKTYVCSVPSVANYYLRSFSVVECAMRTVSLRLVKFFGAHGALYE
jgi:hypothetical protein